MNTHTQLWLLGIIRALRALMITMPIIVLYFQSYGLSVRDVFVLQVIFSIAIVVLEVPTGYLADKFGRKPSLIFGLFMSLVGFFIYWIQEGFWGFVMAEIALAFAMSFISGADTALLYETLKKSCREHEYKKVHGLQMGVSNISQAAGAIFGAYMGGQFGLDFVFLVQWMLYIPIIILAFWLHETNATHEHATPALLKILHGSVKENVRLRYLNLFAGVISTTTLTMVWFSQAHWESIGVPIVYFGILWAILNVCVALGSFVAHRLEHWFRFRELFFGLALAPLVLFAAMSIGADSLYVLVIVPLFWLYRGLQVPIISDYVQRECKDGERATVLSINALVGRLVFSVCSPFLGWIADVWNFQTAFAASAVVFGILSMITFLYLYTAMQKRIA